MVGAENMIGALPPPPEKKHSVTKPISLTGPMEVDVQRSVELEKLLIDPELYENKEETAKREEVLGQIGQIERGRVKMLTRQKGYTDQMV